MTAVSSSNRTRTSAIAELLSRPLASYQLVVGLTSLLLGIGLLMVLSASSVYSLQTYGSSYHVFLRQLVFALAGGAAFLVALRLPLKTISRFAPALLAVSVVLILLTYTPLGLRIQGNRNWLPLFAGFNLQPSEFAKLGLILWAARVYTFKRKQLDNPIHILSPVVVVAVLVALLVVGQHDLGTALVLFAITASLLWFAGLPMRYLGAVMAALGAVAIFFVATSPNRVRRMLNFLNPWADPEGAGHQAIKALLAFGRGGFWGVGLGGSRQKWGALPEAHNDFIFAVLGEELGLAGALVVLGLFLLLGYVGLRIAMRTQDTFARYAAAGITAWIIVQAIINIGMVLGLLPVIGLPLPLISYGGSSLLITLAALGVLANCATTEPGAAKALEQQRKARKRRRQER